MAELRSRYVYVNVILMSSEGGAEVSCRDAGSESDCSDHLVVDESIASRPLPKPGSLKIRLPGNYTFFDECSIDLLSNITNMSVCVLDYTTFLYFT